MVEKNARYALLDITISNFAANLGGRLANAPFSYANVSTAWNNAFFSSWIWEDGDRFLVNQLGHPYQGSTYFSSARANGFSFYESFIFASIGSVSWEVLFENVSPSFNDFITTSVGGIALGEMFHRLFLELDSLSSWGARIGGFFISPVDAFNKIYNRPAVKPVTGSVYDLTLKSGVEKTHAYFKGHQNEANSWNYPGGSLEVDVVYGDPFMQESRTPYEQFEMNVGIATNINSYDAKIVSDGYLFSFALSQNMRSLTSTGLTMHFDFFNVSNDPVNNTGYGNIQFSSNAIDWSIKHLRLFSDKFQLELKAHLGITLWGNTMYNSNVFSNTYLGNTHSTYGAGENAKLFLSLAHQKWGKLQFTAQGYHIFSIPVDSRHLKGNVFFLNGSVDYNFPLTPRIRIGIKQNFLGLLGFYDAAEPVKRFISSTGIYVNLTPKS